MVGSTKESNPWLGIMMLGALVLAPWQGLPLDSAGRWKVSLADEISSLPLHTLNPTWWQAQEQRAGQ